MIYTSLAVLAMSASAAMSPLSNLVHLHPRAAQADARVVLTIYNNAYAFRDLKIGSETYTVGAHHTLQVKAPAGTAVYAESTMMDHRRGDLVLQVTPQLNHRTITIN